MEYRLYNLQLEIDWLKQTLKSQKLLFDSGYKVANLDFYEPFYIEEFLETLYQIDKDCVLEFKDEYDDEKHLHLFHKEMSEYVSLANQYGKMFHIRQKDNFWFKKLNTVIRGSFGEELYSDYYCSWQYRVRNYCRYPVEYVFMYKEEFYNFVGALTVIIEIKNFLLAGIAQMKAFLAKHNIPQISNIERKAA